MRRRISLGVALDHDAVRLACLKAGALEWFVESSPRPDEEPCACLRALLDAAPAADVCGADAGIAVAQPFAQLRVIAGLPTNLLPAQETALLAGSPHRWFLGRPGGLRVSNIERCADGHRRAVAIPSSLLDGVRGVLEDRGINVRFASLGPALRTAVLPLRESPDAPREPQEGVPAPAGSHSPHPTVPFLRDFPQLGDRSVDFASAVGAALCIRVRTPIPFSVDGHFRVERAISRPRALVAQAAVLIGLMVTSAAWPATVLVTSRRLDVDEAAAAGEHSAPLAAAIASVTRDISLVEERARDRNSIIALLEVLRRSLPADAAVVAFRLDSTEGQITVLGPRVGVTVEALEATGVIRRARLVGAVTTEAAGGALLERATIAFAFPEHDRR